MIIALLGPTASGKSELSMVLARELPSYDWFCKYFPGGIQIVGADAMALYRGMDIGTAKATKEERKEVPHHQIDVLWPDERASVRAYQRNARKNIEQIRQEKALPVVVGGSGLYVRALLDKLEFPPTDPAIREMLNEKLQQEGPLKLHERLCELDPKAGKDINPKNGRRIVRALEAIQISGKPFKATLPNAQYFHQPTYQFYINHEIEILEKNIHQRTEKMIENGLIEETQTLLDDKKHPLGQTAVKATGYEQIINYINGKYDLRQAKVMIEQATIRLAKKQHKWFKRDKRMTILDNPTTQSAAKDIIENLREALDNKE